MPTGYEEVEETEDYSTSETNTGKKWIDGRPIYRVVLTGTLPVGAGGNDFYIDDNGEIRNVHGMVKSIYNQWWPIPVAFHATEGYRMDCIISGTTTGQNPTNRLSIECGAYYNTSSRYFIIIEYTKTTD